MTRGHRGSCRAPTYFSLTLYFTARVPDMTSNWTKLPPNVTNLGIFFSKSKWTENLSKSHIFVPIRSNSGRTLTFCSDTVQKVEGRSVCHIPMLTSEVVLHPRYHDNNLLFLVNWIDLKRIILGRETIIHQRISITIIKEQLSYQIIRLSSNLYAENCVISSCMKLILMNYSKYTDLLIPLITPKYVWNFIQINKRTK